MFRWLLTFAIVWAASAQDRAANIEKAAQLTERMRELKVPSVSVAVVEGGKIAWTKVWGPGDADTVFQAASISKPVAATAALHMMQHGNFTLDEDVNGKLKSWQVPKHGFEGKVTLRELLSHSAGLTVHGFPGYAFDAPVPSLVQILKGEKPANTPPIFVDIEPGSKWRYSGGGYTVMQQLLIDRFNAPFPQLMQRIVLGSIGMKRSTYEQPLPAAMASNAAIAHKSDGTPYAGKWHTYPEMAAAGLWTTPSDLARWAIEIRETYLGKSNRVMERGTVREMLTRQKGDYGLGVGLDGEGQWLRFGHGGSNAGYRCMLTLFAESGNGVAMMTNSDSGGRLLGPLWETIAKEYGWVLKK